MRDRTLHKCILITILVPSAHDPDTRRESAPGAFVVSPIISCAKQIGNTDAREKTWVISAGSMGMSSGRPRSPTTTEVGPVFVARTSGFDATASGASSEPVGQIQAR